MIKKKFIDINGLGHSGKGAISDLLREVKGVHLYDHLFEFDLVRISGGLIDLKHNILDYWSPIRANTAIKKFIDVSTRMSKSDYRSVGHKINSYGTDYESIFNNNFLNETHNYINNLISYKVRRKFWPYNLIDKSTTYLFFYKLLRKLNMHHKVYKNHNEYLIIDRENFLRHTHNYFNNLFSHMNITEANDTIILHNTLEPYDTIKGIDIIPNLKVINVIRDPRDTYASTLTNKNVYIPSYISDPQQWIIKQNFLGTENINEYIKIQKMQLDNYIKQDHHKILNLKYEDIVLNYEDTKTKIFNFLKIDESLHIDKKKFFDPELSKSNVGIWKRFSDLKEIKKINKELNKFYL